MDVILGAAGKVGRATVTRLRAAGRPVRAVLHQAAQADDFRRQGCEVAIADIDDLASLQAALVGASQVQVICPVAGKAADAAGRMRGQIDLLAAALEYSKPAHLLAISDYGAEQEAGTGVTLVFRYMEAVFRRLPMALTLLRSSEQMQNWARVIPIAARDGILPSLHHPVTKQFPTVAAQDVGMAAADLLLEQPAPGERRIVHIEGPRRYAAADVAAILGELLGRPVQAQALPQEAWRRTLTGAGLSESYADLVVELFTAHNTGRIDAEPAAGPVIRGTTALKTVLASLLPPS